MRAVMSRSFVWYCVLSTFYGNRSFKDVSLSLELNCPSLEVIGKWLVIRRKCTYMQSSMAAWLVLEMQGENSLETVSVQQRSKVQKSYFIVYTFVIFTSMCFQLLVPCLTVGYSVKEVSVSSVELSSEKCEEKRHSSTQLATLQTN